jgi:hypothetical protein
MTQTVFTHGEASNNDTSEHSDKERYQVIDESEIGEDFKRIAHFTPRSKKRRLSMLLLKQTHVARVLDLNDVIPDQIVERDEDSTVITSGYAYLL